jgi:quinol monooxygenase YgiN
MLHAIAMRDDPTQIRLLEVYSDQTAYEAHLQSPHFLRYKALTAAMVLSLQLFETDPILLRAKP